MWSGEGLPHGGGVVVRVAARCGSGAPSHANFIRVLLLLCSSPPGTARCHCPRVSCQRLVLYPGPRTFLPVYSSLVCEEGA